MANLVVGPDAYRDLPRLLDQLLLSSEEEESQVQQVMNVQLSLVTVLVGGVFTAGKKYRRSGTGLVGLG
jgi:hypothetical protein